MAALAGLPASDWPGCVRAGGSERGRAMIRVATLSLIRVQAVSRFEALTSRPVRGDAQRSFTARSLAADALVLGLGTLAVLILMRAVAGAVAPIAPAGVPARISLDPALLPLYAARSVLRMLVALACSFVFALAYGLSCARSRRLCSILLPLLDVLQSVPVLGFLSATVTVWLALFPGSMLGVEAASIFAIFTSQAWNMALSFYQSLAGEPAELDEMARSFRLTRWQRFWTLDVPFGLQQLIWNAMMSMGGAWFFLSASEFISVNGRTMALPGIGSFAALAAEAGRMDLVGLSALAMCAVILALDILLWRPLTAWSERLQGSSDGRRSLVLEVLRSSSVAGAMQRAMRVLAELLNRVMGRLLGRTGICPWWELRVRALAGRVAVPRVVRAIRGRTGLDRALGTLATIALGSACVKLASHAGFGYRELGDVLGLGAVTFARVAVVTALCSLIWVPVGVKIGMNARLMRVAQPLVQLVASFPVSLLFPWLVLAMARAGIGLGMGSLLLMALGSQWYILFNVIAAASAVPAELRELADIMRMSAGQRWRQVYLPAVAGAWVSGALATAGGAWNASVVAEVVGTGANAVSTLGLGSYIAAATTTGDAVHAAAGIAVMCALVVLTNVLVWKPLQNLAARRFALN